MKVKHLSTSSRASFVDELRIRMPRKEGEGDCWCGEKEEAFADGRGGAYGDLS